MLNERFGNLNHTLVELLLILTLLVAPDKKQGMTVLVEIVQNAKDMDARGSVNFFL